MPLAEFSALRGASRFVLANDGNRILIIAFAGKHHYSHGLQMASQIEAAAAGDRLAGLLIDLLEYDYEFGNDVCGLFMAGYQKESKTLVPSCIVATGKTRHCMESLYMAGNFELALGPDFGFAGSFAEGLAWLSRTAARET